MPVTVIQPSNIDTMINANAPAVNYGANVGLYIGESAGSADKFRTLIRFDLSSIPPGSQILSAYLELYMYFDDSNSPTEYKVYRLLRAWTELGATWNTYDGVNNWETAGAAGALDRESVLVGTWTMPNANPPLGWYGCYLDPASVQGMLNLGGFTNNGWLIRATGEVDDDFQYRSRENLTVAERPRLTISWAPGLGRLPAYIVDGLQGGITLKATVEQFANDVWVRHTPVGGALTRSPTPHAIDIPSKDKFGWKDQPLSGGSAAVDIATQVARTYLDFQSSPNMPDITIASGTIIRDQNGNIVPLEEIRPNNWLLVENLALPTGQVFTSLTQNPMALFIEEVDYNEASGLGITAGRDRFVQALVAKIAGRSSG